MGENLSGFGSDTWILEIRDLGFEVQRCLQKRHGGQYLRFRDELIVVEKLGIIEKHGILWYSY